MRVFVGRQPARGVQAQLMIQHRGLLMSAQIEIGVVGEVYHGGAVFDGSPHLESEGTVVGPDVAGISIEFAGIALFAVVRGVMECHRVVEHVLNLPYTILEAGGSAVQGVRTVVYGQRIGVAVEFEVAAGYTVGIAARNLAGAGSVGEVIVGIVVAYHHIGHTAFLHPAQQYSRYRHRGC